MRVWCGMFDFSCTLLAVSALTAWFAYLSCLLIMSIVLLLLAFLCCCWCLGHWPCGTSLHQRFCLLFMLIYGVVSGGSCEIFLLEVVQFLARKVSVNVAFLVVRRELLINCACVITNKNGCCFIVLVVGVPYGCGGASLL